MRGENRAGRGVPRWRASRGSGPARHGYGPHLGFGMSCVPGKAELAHRRAHGPCPVADRNHSQQPFVQDGEVARQSSYATCVQGGECLGDGLAHQCEGEAICGEAAGVGSAAVKGRSDACDERGMVGKPAVHVGHAPDSEPAVRQRRFERCQPGINNSVSCRRHIVRRQETACVRAGWRELADPRVTRRRY